MFFNLINTVRLMFRAVCLFLLFVSFAQAEVDFSNLKEKSLLSAISYSKAGSVASKLDALEYKLIRHSVIPSIQVAYYLADNKKEQLLAFRGTSNLENVLVDLDVSFVLDSRLNIMLHKGFMESALTAYQQILPSLDKEKPVNTTGHSLGGALAVVVAMYLKNDGFDVGSIVTFGQPKVTNVTGARAYASLPLIRVVTPKDIVPLVPPLSPLQLQNLDIYWHVGEELILLEGAQYSLVEGVKSMMRATNFFSTVPNEENIKAHQMETYLSLIENKLEKSHQVPHKMNLNIFGMTIN